MIHLLSYCKVNTYSQTSAIDDTEKGCFSAAFSQDIFNNYFANSLAFATTALKASG